MLVADQFLGWAGRQSILSNNKADWPISQAMGSKAWAPRLAASPSTLSTYYGSYFVFLDKLEAF